MSLADIVNITITSETAGVAQEGFGVPLILGVHTHWSDRIRYYSSITDMVADGFLTTEPEYKAAAAMFAQSPKPEQVAVGRRDNLPTQRWAVTPTVANSAAYKLKVNGTTVTFTSDANATATEIIAGLKAAIDALGLGLTTSDQGAYLRVLANAAGAWFSLEAVDVTRLSVVQDHAASNPGADLSAIQLVDDAWYAIISTHNSSAEVQAIAAWAEAAGKLYVAATQDTDVIGTAAGGTDVGSVLDAAEYARTALIYHPDNGAFADAAWAGAVLPMDPGSETWKFKQLSGVASVSLTGTHLSRLRDKSVNYVYTVAGLTITADGVVSAGEFIDTIRGRDWLEARMQERIFQALAGEKKIPFTDAGIAVVEAEVRAQLADGIAVGFLSSDPAPDVSVPKASAVSPADRAARHLTGVVFDATIAGAIHKLTIRGNVRV